MFTDELYEDLIINKSYKITAAHIEVIKKKKPNSPVGYAQIENGFQLFRKRYSTIPEDSFRRFIYLTLYYSDSIAGERKAKNLFGILKWKIDPNWTVK